VERCQYLKEQLNQDYKLLKQLEDERRCETNPRRKLGLNADIEEIEQRIRDRETELKSLGNNQNNSINIDTLVQQIRQQRHDKIQDQCGTMRMLDISQPIAISDIYTNVNILEEIPSQQWLDASDLARNFNAESDNFDRLGLGRIVQRRVPGLDAVSRYDKLMVLGKPGSGKTTFLQWVAIKCDLGELQGNRVPIFIRLKNFAEDTKTLGAQRMVSLQDYINEEFVSCGITDKSVVETILTQGKALILLDGLDEVLKEDDDEVIKQVRRFVEKFFKNKFIITCRIAAQKYRFVREGFSDVEVADFDDKQVKLFAKKWFTVARNNPEAGEATAMRFIERLNLPENQQISELAVTPILLNLTCLVFSAKDEFPSKRSQLYEQGLGILLIRWDEERGVERDKVYRNLSVEHKIELLSQVATITFEKNHYFFEQREIQQYIADYLRTLPYEQTDQLTLQQDSNAVLKSIAEQHGLLVERAREIYSFSHLTFQEYLTAREIEAKSDIALLVSKITEKRWREVFLLTAGMMRNADELVQQMKREIDGLVAVDEKLQRVLTWVNQKSLSVEVPYKPSAARAFYFSLVLSDNHVLFFDLDHVLFLDLDHLLSHDLILSLDLDCELDRNFSRNLVLDYDISHDLVLDRFLSYVLSLDRFLSRNFDLVLALANVFNPELKQSLQQLKDQLPSREGNDKEQFNQWWQINSRTWMEQLRTVMIQHCNIGHDWQFSDSQKQLLQNYYNGNQLLVHCLKSDCDISQEVRQEIEDTLLLPIGIILLLHLIKKVAENRTTKSWQVSIFNSVKQIQRTNRRHKAKGTYLTEDELRETLQDAYESALRNAALEAFEGTYEAEEIDAMVNREEIIEMAMDLILERQSTDGTSED
jgi:predicted NACHT family NTPase